MATALVTATVDFGATPVDEKDFVVADGQFAGQTYAEAWFMADSTVDNDADAHEMANALIHLCCETPGAGTLAIRSNVIAGLVTGQFKIRIVATS